MPDVLYPSPHLIFPARSEGVLSPVTEARGPGPSPSLPLLQTPGWSSGRPRACGRAPSAHDLGRQPVSSMGVEGGEAFPTVPLCFARPWDLGEGQVKPGSGLTLCSLI